MASNNVPMCSLDPSDSPGRHCERVLMLRELNMERQGAVAARERALRERTLIGSSWARTTAVTAAAASVTVTVPDPTVRLGKPAIPKASRIFGMSAPMLQGALLGALPSIAVGLAAAYCASPDERANVWEEAVWNTVKGMGLGGMAGYMMDKISRALLELGSRLTDTAWLGSTANPVKQFVPPAAFAAIDIGYQCIRWFYHLICYYWAKKRKDTETANIESKEMGNITSVDNGCVLLAHGLTQVASTSTATWIAAGGLGFMTGGAVAYVTLAFPVCAIIIADTAARAMLERKNASGGWGLWLQSFFITDRRNRIWGGKEYEDRCQEISEELRCDIFHTVVVDPVRSTFTGALYERAALFRWLDQCGTDPCLVGEKATRLDYIPAPVAKKWAHRWAKEIGGCLEIEDLGYNNQ